MTAETEWFCTIELGIRAAVPLSLRQLDKCWLAEDRFVDAKRFERLIWSTAGGKTSRMLSRKPILATSLISAKARLDGKSPAVSALPPWFCRRVQNLA
jgi:hypothetical protein